MIEADPFPPCSELNPTRSRPISLRKQVRAHQVSGDDVGQQLALDLYDPVFEQQLSLFQPLQLELVDRRPLGETRYYLVEVAMFGFQGGEFRLQSFDVEIHGHARRVWRDYSTPNAPGTIGPVAKPGVVRFF